MSLESTRVEKKNFEAKPQFEEKTFTRKADMLKFWNSCEATVKEKYTREWKK